MAIPFSSVTLPTTSILFLTLLLLSPPVTGICRDDLVSFSACLPYTAAPPNNFSNSVSADCCDKFSKIILSGNGFCLCYFLQDSEILGFPLNSSRVLSLSTLCPPQRTSSSQTVLDLHSICLDFERPSPIQSPEPGQWNHSNSSDLADGPMTTVDSMPNSGGSSLAPPDLDPDYSSHASSASIITSIYHWLLPKSFPLVLSSAALH